MKRRKEQSVSALEALMAKYPPRDKPKSNTRDRSPQDVGEKHRIAGTSFRQKAIASLGEVNEEYSYTKNELIENGLVDEHVYQMTFSPREVQLVEEPDNQYDPNAIKVIIDGVHVGYVKKESATHVGKLMRSGAIRKITAEIGGGKYKIIESEYDDEKDKDIYTLEKDETDYYVSIRIITE